ncbi:MAG: AraC family transcriptional regulator [Alicyclobacillus sp.]|nr:AraC family transcriptional regulator [Alicyclobacillus sp.]
MEYRVTFSNPKLPVSITKWTPKPYVEPFHWHHFLEVGYCVSGKGLFHFGDKTYEVDPGDVFIVNNLERHIAQSDPEDPSVFLFLYFDPSLIDYEDRELLLPFIYNPKHFDNRIPAALAVAEQIGFLTNQIWLEMRKDKTAYQAMVKASIMQICVLLLRHFGQSTTREGWNRVYHLYKQLQPALMYLKQNFREQIELEEVAAYLSLSPSRTRHLFKEATGEGFKEFLIHLRVNEAKKLLVTTDMSITDVYLNCGFQSHAPFYRAFKQITGITPNEYRDQFSILALLEKEAEENELAPFAKDIRRLFSK